MLCQKLEDHIIAGARESNGALLYQKRGKVVLEPTGEPVARIVIADRFNPEIAQAMNAEKIMYYLISVDGKWAREYYPDGFFNDAAYLGRPYIYGLFDCFTLGRDWLERERGVLVPWNFERPFMWWAQGANLYMEMYKAAGFVNTSEINEGCVFFSKMGSQTTNHAGIILSDNKILHHPAGRFSCIEPMTETMLKNVTSVIKYEGASV